MRSSRNGNPQICVNNLLRIFRGEIPYERVKGLDPRIIDRPYMEAQAAIQQDAEWLIGTYEPRVETLNITAAQMDAASGQFAVTADVVEKEE